MQEFFQFLLRGKGSNKNGENKKRRKRRRISVKLLENKNNRN